MVEFGEEGGVELAVEFHDQEAVGGSLHHAVYGWAVDGDAAAEVDHGAVDEFYGFGVEGDEVAGGFHGAAEGGELANS